MECVLFRHGIAVKREEWEGKDVDRPLTEKGKRRVRRGGSRTAQARLRPTVIYASPARRAVGNGSIAVRPVGEALAHATRDELLPEAPPTDWSACSRIFRQSPA